MYGLGWLGLVYTLLSAGPTTEAQAHLISHELAGRDAKESCALPCRCESEPVGTAERFKQCDKRRALLLQDSAP